MQMPLTWEEFEKVDMRVGTIIEVNDFPAARKPAYQLRIDFGPVIGIRNSSAQVTIHYKKDQLLNKQVIAVVNFAPKKIANFMSECLVLGIYDANNDVILLEPNLPSPNGSKIG
jgi:tRNA-binding protein